MSSAPQRIHTHEIDSKACAIVSLKFSKNWELRDLTGRDFGVDKIAERFQDGVATSELLMLQIKGTESEIDEKKPRFSLDTKTLIYAEMFSVPFLLLYCSVNEPSKCYYLWLQEYIRVRLNYDNPNWRNQGTNTLYFPTDNLLDNKNAEEHLCYISQFPKYQSSWVGYYLSLNDLCYNMPSVLDFDLFDKTGINVLIEPMVKKLIEGTNKFGDIPRRFIPDIFEQTISLGKSILENKNMSDKKDIIKFIANCSIIQTSVEVIASRFDSTYLRILYEVEGSADF